jgi:hypothetical protein
MKNFYRNEEMNAGSYEVTWNAPQCLPAAYIFIGYMLEILRQAQDKVLLR